LFGFEPLVIGGGRIVTPDGRGAWGFFAGSGVHVWIWSRCWRSRPRGARCGISRRGRRGTSGGR